LKLHHAGYIAVEGMRGFSFIHDGRASAGSGPIKRHSAAFASVALTPLMG
jgi:hypothetical protein